MNSFFKELSQKKVIITLGTGGVGKTTLSASVGMKCALLGKKVLVSTIDPAKRLVTALSLDSLSGEPQKVELDLKNGEFYAMMLDMKSAWDNLIIRNVSSAQKRQKILSNKFYHHLSTRLAGSLEYMALSKLFDLYKSGDYDVVIIDTPPLANAMDFLDAPKKIHDFVDHQAMKWLFSPAIGKGALKFFKFSSNFLNQNIAKFTGTEFLQELSEFLLEMVETFETFKERGHGIENLLRSDECAFLLVGGPNSEHLRSLEQFLKDLRSRGLDISGVIFNRMAVEAKYLAKEKSTSKRLEELGLSAQDAQVLLNSYRLEARDHKRQMNSIKIFKDESLNSTNTVLLLEEQIIQNLSREKLPFLLENCQKL